MSNSLRWRPSVSDLRVLAALLAAGLAFFGVVIRRGGRSFDARPLVGYILMIMGAAAFVLALVTINSHRSSSDERSKRD